MSNAARLAEHDLTITGNDTSAPAPVIIKMERPRQPRRGGWKVYVAASTVLSDPGPTAMAIVVVAPDKKVYASRSWFIGQCGREEGERRALRLAKELATTWNLPKPTFMVSNRALTVGDAQVHYCASRRNLAQPLSVAPQSTWLPERSRRATAIVPRHLGAGLYEVRSQSDPNQVYLVNPIRRTCQCRDSQCRQLPCKHIMAAARAAGMSVLTVAAGKAARDVHVRHQAPRRLREALEASHRKSSKRVEMLPLQPQSPVLQEAV